MAERLTAELVRADVAALLYVNADEIDEGDNLFDSGLDSIRLLTLLEKWREAGVVVSFVELAEQPTLADWSRLLTARQPVVLDA
ncbi:phosphopantetheine-binding protein [Actinophytocola algeriensis]|uniref:Bifunctional isochorismate lyase/aryl carrier protein n=1 Tax=Actinophytocola algeriensis TaxID=1768010 RepID=A0A7W7Q9I7_9PSEU|nr:phosphopantetheine-binding protein [Actinophytocola algeriensis]MBB4909489.1 bifunctional isochorismate lyase/aryl carrier protein [Actinophytocola algeriensis]MBE1475479.1 bifunctional isochorismate lyase/aryl carrier protein [Actinophytocola algeriensis]